MDNNSDFSNDYFSNEWKCLTNQVALFVKQGQIINDYCWMFGMCFCVLKLTLFQIELAKKSSGCGHICFCFCRISFGSEYMYTGGVTQGKLEIWSKLGGIRVFSA